jgi:superfamily I DNA/RNA helicase
MPKTDSSAKAADPRRAIARTRAATLLQIPESAIENDLVDFVIAKDGDVLLRARAGSGKTTALGIKVAFLILDEGVDPSSIMMLAFNNAAARGLEAKLKEFGVPDGVRVRTFHALGQRIVRAHFGGARTPVFDEKSEDGQALADMMQETLDEIVNDRFFFFCASKMRTHYGKRKEYVESVGRDALMSAVQFLRARGYGLQNRFENAWDEAGPIGGNAMKAIMGYEIKMKDARLLDATGVLQAASWTLEREIETGNMKQSDAHDLDWIFIDEFQDVSLPYMRLVEAIRNINGMLNVVGVGDDWQGINGFAGADLDYFQNPSNHLDDPDVLDLLRNRRSGSDIVEWGNNVMIGAGYPDAPALSYPGNGQGQVDHARISAYRDLRVASERLSKLVDPSMTSVALIARKWKVGDYTLPQIRKLVEQHLRERGYKGSVTGITAHGSKGQEYDQVLLLDDGSFPIEHPSRPILEALIPDAEYLREEACLKHVAGTRARKILHHVDMTK